MTKLIIAAIIALSVFGAALLGASAQTAQDARVRVIHASPDAPAVDVYADGDQVLSDVPFGASSGYLSVAPGSYTFEVFAAGADPDSDSAVLTIPADLAAGTDYTVVALDRVAQIKQRVFVDDNSAPAAGQAHINVIHASPDAPAVDVAVTGGPVLVSDLGFGSQEGPLPVDAGTYDLELRAAGTDTVALPLPGVELESGVIYTFVATGFLEDDPALTVLTFTETPAVSMAPPRTGDGGLAAQAEETGLATGVIAATAVGLLAGTLLLRRNA